MLSTFVRIMRIVLGGILAVLALAAFIYIFAGSWAFDINVEQVTYWFLFTAVVILAACIVIVCLAAIISLLFGGLVNPFTNAPFGFFGFIPFALCAILVFIIFIIITNWVRELLGYPYVEITEMFRNLFDMLGLNFPL